MMLAAAAAHADVLKFEKINVRPWAKRAIGPVDNRVWLTVENGEKLGLSAAEVTRVWRSTGFISCEGGAGSAALVFDDRHIVTAAHVIIDRNEPYGAFRKNCAFNTHDANRLYVRHPLMLNSDTTIVGTRNTTKYPGYDWAIVKLERPVSGGIPFVIGDERISKAGNQILAIASDQDDKPNAFHPDNPGLPLAQKCEIQEVGQWYYTSNFKSECDLNHGASGGVSLMRLDGELVLVGITIRGGRLLEALRPVILSIVVTDDIPIAIFQLGAGAIRPSTRKGNALLAGEIGDELSDSARLIARTTEVKVLNDPTSSGLVRWKSGAVSGFVAPLKNETEESENCRSFVHAVIYASTRTRAAKGRVCRDKSGRWVVVKDGRS